MYNTIEEAANDLNAKYGKQDIESLESRFGKTQIGYTNLDFTYQLSLMSRPCGIIFYFKNAGTVTSLAIVLNSNLFIFDEATNKYKLL